MSTSPTTGSSSVLNTTTASAASAQTATGLSSLTSNFQSFLSLLTTQLQNQDPTNPMDTNPFTQQLVEMTGVQQQLLSNNLLTTLVAQGQGGLSNSINYIGDTVQATDANQTLTNGSATWSYNLASQAANATITITDSLGQHRLQRHGPEPECGREQLHLERQGFVRRPAPERRRLHHGGHRQDAAGNPVTTQVLTIGTATAATVVNGAAYLTINGNAVPVSSVVSVQPPSSSSSSSN